MPTDKLFANGIVFTAYIHDAGCPTLLTNNGTDCSCRHLDVDHHRDPGRFIRSEARRRETAARYAEIAEATAARAMRPPFPKKWGTP